MTKRKYRSWPSSLYVIHFTYEPGYDSAHRYVDPELDETTESIAVDADSFIDVEDFAMATCPKDWAVATVEKTYVYAEMYGGEDGKWIDVLLNDGVPTFRMSILELNEGSYNYETQKKRKTFLGRIAKQYRENAKTKA